MNELELPGRSTLRFSRRSLVGGAIGSALLLAGTRTPKAFAASASVISRGSTSSPNVALTFDCGSDSGHTSSILNTAASYGVKLTFGVTGQFAASYPSLVARMVNEGHDIMNHSYSHASFTGTSSSTTLLSTWARQDDLERTETAIANASGRGGRPLFRPPYGDYNNSVLVDVGAIGFTWCVMWSIDVLGWNGLSYSQVVNRALGSHGNGYIYLMHVGGASQEGPALGEIIQGLRNRGYGFVTISQMTGSSPAPPPPPTNPPPSGSGHAAGTKLRVTTPLNLRSSASTGSGIIATMPAGTIVTVVSGPSAGSGFTWYQVDTSYGRGWAAMEYMEVSSAPAPPPPPPSTPTGHAPGTTLKVTSGLWLRTAGNLSGGVITTMPTGTIVTVVSGPSPSGGYTWYQLDTPYGRGWAAGEFLQVTSAPPSEPPPPAPSGHAPGTKLKVTSGLWLRTAGNLGGGVITTMPTGTVVTVVSGPSPSGGYTWYQLDTPYGRGWAAGEFLVVTSDSPSPPPSEPPPPEPPPSSGGWAPGTKVRVTSGLWLRTAGNLSGSVITTMPTGTVCTVVSGPAPSGGYTWYQLDTPYGRGWAAAEFLTPTTDAPSPPPTSGGHPPGTRLRVTSGLWLRTAGNLSGGVMTTMPTGTIVTVVSGPSPSGGYTWYELDTPYDRGWAAGEFLSPA